MKALFALFILLLSTAAYQSFAFVRVENVSQERAKELGVSIRSKMAGANAVDVWLKFQAKGELKGFRRAVLEIGERESRVLSAALLPDRADQDNAVFYFSAAPATLARCTLTIMGEGGPSAKYDAYAFRIRDFVEAGSTRSTAEQPETMSLMTMIGRWQYPDSRMSGAEASDAATLNGAGERTRPSAQYKAVMSTKDPLPKVVAYYKAKLAPSAAPQSPALEGDQGQGTGRSVTFHEDSAGRPLAVSVILVNTDTTSTTLVVSRAEAEPETHIAWTYYLKL